MHSVVIIISEKKKYQAPSLQERLVVAYLYMLLQLKLFEQIDLLRRVQSLGASMHTVLDIMAAV